MTVQVTRAYDLRTETQKCCHLLGSESESISPLQIIQLFCTDQGSHKCLLRFLCVIKRAENTRALLSLSLQWVRAERRLMSVFFNFRVSPAVTVTGDGSCEQLFPADRSPTYSHSVLRANLKRIQMGGKLKETQSVLAKCRAFMCHQTSASMQFKIDSTSLWSSPGGC